MAVSISNCTDLIASKGGGTVAKNMGAIRDFISGTIGAGTITNLQGQYDAISAWTPGGGGGGGGGK